MKTLAALACVLACGSAGTAVALERNRQLPLPVSTPQAQGISVQRLSRLHGFIQGEIDNQDYLGAVTLIARNGHIVDWRAYGSRDLARTTPMDRRDIFRIYSMTKTLASVAALVLMEEGRFAIEDPVSRYLPQFASTQVMVGGSADAPGLQAASCARSPFVICSRTPPDSHSTPGT
ncbi:MAG: beta-lactamase family protein, partial [Gammaproteobacteria bacterium]|nr:beta-lactamase family protein [Gammaproteobacteria bacterium]